MSSECHVVLVVDDDQTMLRSVEAMLRRGGYCPIAALGPLEALNKAREFQGDIHLLLTDIVMPDMDGIELAEQLAVEHTAIRVLLMTAYANGTYLLPVLRKPFRMEELLKTVRYVIDGPLFAVATSPSD